jgi:DNA-binding winged helix-turn-helix (wHTH) protein/tetratricopeptide (TPR) repeat protein
MSLIRIGEYTLDCSDGTLVSATETARLEPKVLAVLMVLVERAGLVVPKEVLLSEVWSGTHVSAGSLARTISILRRALGDDARGQTCIETIPKRGYRLNAIVGTAVARPTTRVRRVRASHFVAVAAMFVAALIAGTRPARVGPPPALQQDPKATETGRPKTSNRTRADNENAFAYYAGVVANNPASADAYAGLSLAYAFRANYLTERSRWAADAITAATRATELDPANVQAVRALAIAHAQAGRLRQAAEYYQRALDLCPHDAPTRTNLGIALMAMGRVTEALELFEQHVVTQPDSVEAHAYLANGLLVAGYPAEATAVARVALAIEPYAVEPQLVLVRASVLRRDYAAARMRLERLLEVWPDCSKCESQLGLVEQLTGATGRAETRYLKARMMSSPSAIASLRLAHLWATEGRANDTARILNAVESEALAAIDAGSEAASLPWQLAAAAAIRQDRSSAARWYLRAIQAGRIDATWDDWEPMLASLRTTPEFAMLKTRFGAEHRAAAPIVSGSESIKSAIAQPLAPRFRADLPGWPR